MAQVIITRKLEQEINKKFKKESIKIFSLMRTLEDNPSKGKDIDTIGGIVVKELKYGKFRFYFLTDRFKIKFLRAEQLRDMIMKFVRMSEKKDQQKVIDEIKSVLRKLGDEGF